jgi:hypothetical protein
MVDFFSKICKKIKYNQGDYMAKHKIKKKKKGKVEKVMHEYKEGSLHSGSKKGPKVTNPKQAIAIALSEARKAGESVKPKKKRK